jgi:DNA-binding transcriptional MerR regulator
MGGDTLYSIGDLARRTGLTVRTIRFYSDRGIVPPADRSPAGYRLYGIDAVARLDLVRTLRDLGLDLSTIRRVVDRQIPLAQVAAAHAEALAVQIRVLRLRRAVLTAVAKRGSTPKEMDLMHKLTRLSEDELRRLIGDFLDAVFGGLDADPAFVGIVRSMTPELPDDPEGDQVEAWVELVDLSQDQDFRASMRRMAEQHAAERVQGDNTLAAATLPQCPRPGRSGPDEANEDTPGAAGRGRHDGVPARARCLSQLWTCCWSCLHQGLAPCDSRLSAMPQKAVACHRRVSARACTAGAEDLQRVVDVGEAMLVGDLVGPALHGRAAHLDRRATLPADQVMVVGAAAPAEHLLPATGARRVDLTGVDEQLQGAVDRGKPHLGSPLPQRLMQVLRAAEALGFLQQSQHLGPLAGVARRVRDGLGHRVVNSIG